ncbi:hypothetical protein CC80DRAFT_489210 [Byssothecium circinans]|uniref:Uncharacterized protein n=1 Tax=Byssothecium circinans TaxID=147558 RepID=A0A6A5UAY1_9PLEO|nr:hypothetical protein CC80DRAFT_489210 [Byssothecium circinans]
MAFSSALSPHAADLSLISKRYSPYHPCQQYQHDSEPDSYYRQPPSRGPRPPTTIALKLQDPRIKCERNLGWSIDWAVAVIVDHLDSKNSPDAAAVLKNIRIRAANLEREGYAGEIPHRIFNKLDEVLFAGHLKHAVYLDLRNLGPDVSGSTHTQGWGPDAKIKRVSIILNGGILQEAQSKDIVAALIHHMIHAYFLIACGPQQEKEVAYGRLAHGLPFGKIMMTIKRLSAANKRPLTSLDFGHSIGEPRHFYDEYRYQRRTYQRYRGKEKWYCSHCTSSVEPLSTNEIEDWYNGVCKPLVDLPESLRTSTVKVFNDRRHHIEEVPRGEAEPSTSSNEFIFADGSVLVPASKIDNYFSIARAFEKAGGRYLEIHEDVARDTFERFLELLHTASYSPDPKHIVRTGNRGPPVIKAITGGSEPYILSDIKMYKMGALMNFAELKDIALERMYRHGVTHENPVALLKEIYDGNEPDQDVKTWVRKFLIRVPCGEGGDWMSIGAGMGRGPATEPSNLAKLESDILGFKASFLDLLEDSTALKYEVGQARRELLANNVYAPAALYPGGLAVAQVTRPLSPPAMSPYVHPMSLGGLGMGGLGRQMIGWISPGEAAERERLAERRAAAQVQAQAQAQVQAAVATAAANMVGAGEPFYDGFDDGPYWP